MVLLQGAGLLASTAYTRVPRVVATVGFGHID